MSFDGVVLIDKGAGASSARVLGKFKRVAGVKKCGYAGTLDPFATGLLVVGCGVATKILHDITAFDKGYSFTLKFGAETDSGDVDGDVVAVSDFVPSAEDVKRVILERFVGNLVQSPPVYSAVKKAGVRLCDMARKGFDFDLLGTIAADKAKEINVKNFELVKARGDEFDFTVLCSKGTYVRKLGVDLANALGSKGHLVALRRTCVGSFSVDKAIDLDAPFECNGIDDLGVFLRGFGAGASGDVDYGGHSFMGGFAFGVDGAKAVVDGFLGGS